MVIPEQWAGRSVWEKIRMSQQVQAGLLIVMDCPTVILATVWFAVLRSRFHGNQRKWYFGDLRQRRTLQLQVPRFFLDRGRTFFLFSRRQQLCRRLLQSIVPLPVGEGSRADNLPTGLQPRRSGDFTSRSLSFEPQQPENMIEHSTY